ncbi:MAG: DUF1036 domain-containing protein [Pseudobdellovibrionaceae bacterium]|nr:DUF1036 domain-containing protein [Pseudobdellovibrionaceae bacterium]
MQSRSITSIKKILSLVCILVAVSCGQESEQSSYLADATPGTGQICNKEDVALYVALRSEAGSDMTVSGWRKIAPQECNLISDWLNLKASKSYYIQSEKGLYTPRGQDYSTERYDIICLPFDISLTSSLSYTYNGTAVANSGFCPSGFARYHVTGLGSADVDYPDDDAINLSYTMAGGSFDGSQKISTQPVVKGKSYDDVVKELGDVKRQHEKVKKDLERCEQEVQEFVGLEDVFKINISELDGLKDICGYSYKEIEDLKESIRTFRREAFDGIKSITIEMRKLYQTLLAKSQIFGIVEPIKSFIDQLGIGNLIRPVVDANKGSTSFFQSLLDKYKEIFAKHYQQDTKSFFVSVLGYLSTFSSFGADYVATENIDENSYLDYLKAVEDGEKYFASIDFDKDEYGYPLNSPVPNDIKETIRRDIRPHAPAQAMALDDELKKWEGSLTEKQRLVLDAIRFLGSAFHQTVLNLPSELSAISKRLKAITEGAIEAVKDVTKCIAKVGASGDFADWYEITLGKDYCTGDEISIPGRVLSAAGLVVGSAKFWRVMGDAAGIAVNTKRVFKETEHVAESVVDIIGREKFHEILKMPRGGRPKDVTTYLSKEYIQNHLANFEKGASYLVPKDILDDFGRELLGRSDGQFISTATDINEILKKAAGDVRIIEAELGLPPGSWQTNPATGKKRIIVRIDVPDPKALNLRMPTGNEAAANPLWMPGGVLPNGKLEAVVDQIPKGKYVELDVIK